MGKLKFLVVLFLVAGLYCLTANFSFVSAATLSGAKDTITTSRPSASTPVSSDASAGVTQVSVYDNKSIFLASDSAKFVNCSTGVYSETVTVASQSAARTTVSFTSGTANAQNRTKCLIAPVTAKHTVTFTTVNAVPSGGDIQVIFPTNNNSASPSATAFEFNGLAAGNISISGATCGSSWTITPTSGIVECTNLGTALTGPTAITITIGSSTPALVNPTKTAAIGTGDIWTVQLKTKDASDVDIDTVKAKIATIESVIVYATVEPTLTFSIVGIGDATAINTGNTTGCTNTEVTNTGIGATAPEVNLGVLNLGINITAQRITITTNGAGGYSLTATSSGQLMDPASGWAIANAQGPVTANDTPVPAAITAGTPAFGIHPCGLDVTSGTWGATASNCTSGGTCKYANPSPAYYYTLASDSIGPISSPSTGNGNGIVSVEYGATISAIVPAGNYRTVLTYVTTATF